jgi:hypothetical protein
VAAKDACKHWPLARGSVMTKIIAVHGTNAGDPNDEGEHWWQRNSPFQKRLNGSI